ncbi:MAG: ATP-binding cassette domain-containing protein [Bdellovibrionales bacterium]|nr:ATP-binding cassette domain-containing protein [Bdellovibrionales bacterium]
MSLVKKLKIQYNDFLVDIENWEILDKGVTVLWGPSGSGKTSVFRGLLGLEPKAECHWLMNDIDVGKLAVGERKIGVVFQNYELFSHMTAYQNIRFAAEARNIAEDEFSLNILKLSKKLRVSELLEKNVKLLSGGERQRVALIQAMIGKPNILFLDEPFSALDEELKQESRELIKTVLSEYNIPVLMITHDKRDVDYLADKVSTIKQGLIT